MNEKMLQQYRDLERHYYNVDSYITRYVTSNHIIEKGADSPRSLEKLEKLKQYRQELSIRLHKQVREVFPTLSEWRQNDEC